MINKLPRLARIAAVLLFTGLCAFAQEHKWAGRTLDNFEWAIHEKLAGLPSYGVFDTIRFEVQDGNVILSGRVLSQRVKDGAQRAVGRIDGVKQVTNEIEVLPASRSDDALRMKVYRAIYDEQPVERSGSQESFPIHIIVKNGWTTLEGVVDSDTGRSAVHMRALRVTAHLSNHVRVAPVPEQPDAVEGSHE